MGFKLLTSVLNQNRVTRKVMTSPHALEAFESNADDKGKLVAVGQRRNFKIKCLQNLILLLLKSNESSQKTYNQNRNQR